MKGDFEDWKTSKPKPLPNSKAHSCHLEVWFLSSTLTEYSFSYEIVPREKLSELNHGNLKSKLSLVYPQHPFVTPQQLEHGKIEWINSMEYLMVAVIFNFFYGNFKI